MQSSWRKSALSLSSSFSSFSEQVHRLLIQSFFQRSSSHIFVCIVYFLAFFLTYLSNSPRHTYKLSSHRKMPTKFFCKAMWLCNVVSVVDYTSPFIITFSPLLLYIHHYHHQPFYSFLFLPHIYPLPPKN